MKNREYLIELFSKLREFLLKDEELEFICTGSETALSRFANNSITQNIDQRENEVILRLKQGKKFLNLNSNSTELESLKFLLKRGREDIKYSKEDPYDLNFQGGKNYLEESAYDIKIAQFSPEERGSIISDIVRICHGNDCEANGTLSNVYEFVFICNTSGLEAYFENAYLSLKFVPRYADAVSYNSGTFLELSKFKTEDIVRPAIEMVKASVNPSDFEEGKYTVVFSPHAVTNFLEFLSWYGFNTKNIYEKTVVFHNKLGQNIFGRNITLYDDYSQSDFRGIPFDIEGTPRKKVTLVENGVFKNLLLSRKYAKLMNKEESTGHNFIPEPNMMGVFPINLVLKNGEKSLEEIIKETEDGIYVHNLHYCNLIDHYNLIMTGLTRFGVFRIKNGEIRNPLKNMRFTESIITIFNNVADIASEYKVDRAFFGTGFKTPRAQG
jgi:PmbA protein